MCWPSSHDRPKNGGRLNLASKLVSAAVLAGIVVDVTHDLLNARFHPSGGPIDNVMHAVYVPSMLLVILFGIALASAFVAIGSTTEPIGPGELSPGDRFRRGTDRGG